MRPACRLGHEWGHPSAEEVWNEVRRLSPNHAGMSYGRLEALGGLQWPCTREDHPGTLFPHGRLRDTLNQGPKAPFHAVEYDPPVEHLDKAPLCSTPAACRVLPRRRSATSKLSGP